MKISTIGKLTLGCAMALAASTAFANVTPNLTDGSGNAVKDGSGACVVTSGIVHPDCAGVKAAPVAPARPASPAAPSLRHPIRHHEPIGKPDRSGVTRTRHCVRAALDPSTAAVSCPTECSLMA